MNATCLWIAVCLAGDAASALEFKDATVHDARPMVHYRVVEFKESPVRPLTGEFTAAPGALYGQLPVGCSPETALAVVWLPKAPGGPVLWLDADGDGRLSAAERHVVAGKEIEVPATITVRKTPQLQRVRRTLLFRRPALGTGLRYAVRGYAAGSLDFGGAKCPVLLADGNADGCFDTVGQDRVWVDLNRDGRFDALAEQFPLGKPIVKDGQTYVVRSDPLAAAVSVNLRRPGEGKLRLALAGQQKPGKFAAELVSDLGELVTVEKFGESLPVSHGEYRFASLKLQAAGPDGQPWNYSFDRGGSKTFSVPMGKETTLAMFGKLAMRINLDLRDGKARPSETFTIRPEVIADDELLTLSLCTVGGEDRSRSSEGTAEILLLGPDGKTVSRGMSGFG